MNEKKRARKPPELIRHDTVDPVRISLLTKPVDKEISITLWLGEETEAIGINSESARAISKWLLRAADYLDSF